MVPRNKLIKPPPFAVESGIKALGAKLRIARLRRNLTLADMAVKIGVTRQVLSDAEGGKLTTSIVVYAGMLWAMNLLDHLDPVADPAKDEEGVALSIHQGRERARHGGGGLNNDF